jgi:beta-glucosidase
MQTRPMQWPDGFMWGTGASSTQCEGASPASDWWDWEQAGRAPRSGDGNGFAERYAGDFELLASLGLTHHRLSVDWARLEPSEGEHDESIVAHYRNVLAAAHDHGISPWVCLHHFTLPRWVADAGGFLSPSTRTERWRRHVDFVTDAFGDLVAGWQPINEFNFYARGGYGGLGLPPGRHDRVEVAAVDEQMQLANAEAAVRLRETGRPVCSIFALMPTVLHDEQAASLAFAHRLYDRLWAPGIGLFRDGVLRVPDREPIERPDLAGAFDLIGFSYYAAFGVAEGRPALHPPDSRRSSLGYGIFADGVGLVLDRLHDELPDTPLVVAEFGIGTDDDGERSEYLERGLGVVHDAIRRGIDVRGFFHWTAVDNYEWLHGYDVKFGLIDVDRNVRASAEVIRREALS